MGPMDLSDVGYDAFLVNGKIESTLKNIRHGEKIRLRIINASASTYFYFNIGQLRNFTVISKDGMPVRPVVVNELLIGIAETYDIIFQMPHVMKTFEAKATAQDITGSAVMKFGMGKLEQVPAKMKTSPYGMDHGGMDHEGMDHEKTHGENHENMGDHGDKHIMPNEKSPKVKRLNYQMLRSVKPSQFSDNLIRAKVIDLELSGDMERYTWYINEKPFSEDKYIEIRENEIITFRFINRTMMHHPMHLHGHFFRVLNGQGDYAPLFHTVDVSPMKTLTIEFHANEPGIWFLHCHNLYHMKMGMARLVKYQGFEPTEELKNDQIKWGKAMTKDDDAFWRGGFGLHSNKADASLGVNAGRYDVEVELEVDQYELDNLLIEATFKKHLGQFLSVGAGIVVEDQKTYAALVSAYNLPGNIAMSGYIRHDGKAIVRLNKHVPLINIAGRPLVLELSSELSQKDQFGWIFELGLGYSYNERVVFGIDFENEDNHKSMGVGIKVKF